MKIENIGLDMLFVGKDVQPLIPKLVIETREWGGEPNNNPDRRSQYSCDVKFVASFRNIEDMEKFRIYLNKAYPGRIID